MMVGEGTPAGNQAPLPVSPPVGRMLRHGLPPQVTPELDDDHPFMPLAVDIAGDLARKA